MLALLLLVATLVSPAPSPAPSASAGPLKEIIRVHSTSLCDEFDSHVNAAIGSAVRNDMELAGLITSLSLPQIGDDLNDNGLRRHRAIDSLVAYADALTADYKKGDAEVRRLRELAKNTTDPAQKIAIKASADSLGGALWRQKKIARDLDGFVAYLYMEEMRWGDRSQVQILGATSQDSTPANNPVLEERQRLSQDGADGPPMIWTAMPGDDHAPPDDRVLTQNAARDFKSRLGDITTDESNAAANIMKAGERC